MPEIDLALHGAFLIEERFKRSYDEEPEVDPNAEVTEEQLAEEAALKAKIEAEEFTNNHRLDQFRELLSISKLAHQAPENTQMKLILPEKMLFKGPDPPPADWKVDEAELRAQEEAAAINNTKAAGKGKKV
jgi:hypothetical protein